jgi:hypothetical protein
MLVNLSLSRKNLGLKDWRSACRVSKYLFYKKISYSHSIMRKYQNSKWYSLFILQMHIMFLKTLAITDQLIIFLLAKPVDVSLNIDPMFLYITSWANNDIAYLYDKCILCF